MKNKKERGSLTAVDVASYLKRLAVLNEHPVTGNQPLGYALSDLASVLHMYGKQPIGDTILDIRGIKDQSKQKKRKSKQVKRDWSSYNIHSIREVLEKESISKGELVELGHAVFGIPTSSLRANNKSQIIERITAAIDNEDALESISEHARKSGASRTS